MLITSLKVFCDLIETQSFSKTAVLNSVTQSAVSQQLKSIEKRQGKQLIERVEKRRLSLTAEGEIFTPMPETLSGATKKWNTASRLWVGWFRELFVWHLFTAWGCSNSRPFSKPISSLSPG